MLLYIVATVCQLMALSLKAKCLILKQDLKPCHQKYYCQSFNTCPFFSMGGVRKENVAKHIKYWTPWQRMCFCLLLFQRHIYPVSAIVMDRFYKQISFWAICCIIFFLWTPFFPCYFSERCRDKMRTDVLLYKDFVLLNITSADKSARLRLQL